MKPLSPQSFEVQFSQRREARDRFRYAQELLGHAIPSGDIAAIYEEAIEALIPLLEKRKFAATTRPGPGRPTRSTRHIPAHVRRAVWERDGGQCTFVTDGGHRCEARKFLEFDHVVEVARGGEASVAGIRLRCRAHNQFEAERTFGTEFMRDKRLAAAEARAEAKARATAARAEAAAAEQDPERDVTPWLRQLGFRADEVRRAAARCAAIPDALLEERIKFGLSTLARGGIRRGIPGVIAAT